jgi:two-component system, OmpR family, KDP operon response regulator KdpE
MNKPRVLVVDDEPQILRFLRPGLAAGDFDVITATTGAEAVKSAATMAPDVIVLDLGLPDKDGKDVIREIRAWSKVPIIILSARDRESEKIESLDLGADDYVNKPFGIGELMARIRASLRNRQQAAVVTREFRAGGLIVDTLKHSVEKDGKSVHLTPKEFDLLLLLVKNSDRVLTHRQILAAVWGPAHTHDVQYLRVFIGQLRQKIEPDPADPALILTESGIGYRFSGDANSLNSN